MDENEITQRLRDAGDRPVPGEVRASHLSRMHAATPVADKPKRFGRLAVAAAAFVGFAVGSTGFAMAGALPAPAQGVAHDVLSVVQVNVPDGEHKNRGECISQVAKGAGTEAEKQAAKDTCKADIEPGKPAHAGQGKGKGKGRPEGVGPAGGHPNDDTDDCKGRPPWAGKGGPEFTEQQKADFHAACGRGADDDADDEAEKPEEQQEKDAEALEEQREAEAEAEPQAPPAPAEHAPADPGAPGNGPPAGDPGAQGQTDTAPELPDALVPADAQDTTEG